MKEVVKKTTIGGQALMEGILMKGPQKTSIVVRKPDGSLESKVEDTKSSSNKYKIFKLPFFRGMGGLYDAIKMGSKALDYSGSFIEDDEDDQGFFEKKMKDKKKGEKIDSALFGLLNIVIVIAFIFIFFFLPTTISNFFAPNIKSTFVLNLIEGIIRIIFFLIYVYAISQIEDIKRVFMYHGAEHKTIFTYEFGEELTVENVRNNSMLHPRCGTSFMFNMVIMSALVLSLFGWPNPWVRFLTRLAILPVLVGITYELNHWIGGSDSKLACRLSKPGLMIQRIATVKEPTDDMIEVAIEALKLVIPENKEDDVWK